MGGHEDPDGVRGHTPVSKPIHVIEDCRQQCSGIKLKKWKLID